MEEIESPFSRLACMFFVLVFLIFWLVMGLAMNIVVIIILCGIMIPIPLVIIFLIVKSDVKERKEVDHLVNKEKQSKSRVNPKPKKINIGDLLDEKTDREYS